MDFVDKLRSLGKPTHQLPYTNVTSPPELNGSRNRFTKHQVFEYIGCTSFIERHIASGVERLFWQKKGADSTEHARVLQR